MASSSSSSSSTIRVASEYVVIFVLATLAPSKHAFACYSSIISFGDSLADTGNLLRLVQPSKTPPHFALLPYGETFFHFPTGRFSDGRLIIDFIAQDLQLPFVRPFFYSAGENVSRGQFEGGVNFAVAGSTALPDSFFEKNGVRISMANVSLVNQLSWFNDSFLPNFCGDPFGADCKKYLESSLVLVGEIGGNDYNHAFLGGKSFDLVESFISNVINAITSAVNELIKLGAVTLMVPGNFPIGCSAAYLTYFQSSNQSHYDPKTGCLNWPNSFSMVHNVNLQWELSRIQHHNPNVTIIYADYYTAAMSIYSSPQNYGFQKGGITACCGGGGPYNVNMSVLCGSAGSSTCNDPSLYVSWDGLHLTEAAYRQIATALLRGNATVPPFSSICNPFSSDPITNESHHDSA